MNRQDWNDAAIISAAAAVLAWIYPPFVCFIGVGGGWGGGGGGGGARAAMVPLTTR